MAWEQARSFITAAAIETSAIIMASAGAFTVLKWIGALSHLSRGLRWGKPLANPPRHKTSHELGLRGVCDRYSYRVFSPTF
jgi:hypothetical protein